MEVCKKVVKTVSKRLSNNNDKEEKRENNSHASSQAKDSLKYKTVEESKVNGKGKSPEQVLKCGDLNTFDVSVFRTYSDIGGSLLDAENQHLSQSVKDITNNNTNLYKAAQAQVRRFGTSLSKSSTKSSSTNTSINTATSQSPLNKPILTQGSMSDFSNDEFLLLLDKNAKPGSSTIDNCNYTPTTTTATSDKMLTTFFHVQKSRQAVSGNSLSSLSSTDSIDVTNFKCKKNDTNTLPPPLYDENNSITMAASTANTISSDKLVDSTIEINNFQPLLYRLHQIQNKTNITDCEIKSCNKNTKKTLLLSAMGLDGGTLEAVDINKNETKNKKGSNNLPSNANNIKTLSHLTSISSCSFSDSIDMLASRRSKTHKGCNDVTNNEDGVSKMAGVKNNCQTRNGGLRGVNNSTLDFSMSVMDSIDMFHKKTTSAN